MGPFEGTLNRNCLWVPLREVRKGTVMGPFEGSQNRNCLWVPLREVRTGTVYGFL